MKVPVVGIFFNEVHEIEGWFRSVQAQREDGIDPVPIIVLNRSEEAIETMRIFFDWMIANNELSPENYHDLNSNNGHTAAFNAAVEANLRLVDPFPWMVSLDPDARFAPRAIHRMLNIVQDREELGMVSPMILVRRKNDDFESPVTDSEIVGQAGHYPKLVNGLNVFGVPYVWRSHFAGKSFKSVVDTLETKPAAAPFSACFCAGLWSTRMFEVVGLPDPRQFRTMNCAEIGYHAQLNGWKAAFAPKAIAFHKLGCSGDFNPDNALGNDVFPVCKRHSAWHYHFGRTLISLKYYPDEIRPTIQSKDEKDRSWFDVFAGLRGVEAALPDQNRREIFRRWNEFDI